MANSSQLVSSSTVHERGGSPLKIVDSKDGHVYYLINATGAKGIANVRFVQYYSSLNQYAPHGEINDPSGFFFVRDAASSGPDHYGDPNVHAGWGMYIWDATKYVDGVQNSGWVLIAKQGDVDWDITDELKAMFVLKTVYNARVNEVDNRFEVDEKTINLLKNRVLILEQDMAYVKPLAHFHHEINDWDDPENPVDQGDNFSVLNRLSDKYDTLYYRGRPITGNSFVYDHVEYRTETGQKEITWCDPTKKQSEWTHEILKNSDEVAQRFMTTAMARIGLSLFVIEVDGSISIYKYNRSNVCAEGSEIWDPNNRIIFDPTSWPPCNIDNLHPRTKYFEKSPTGGEWERIPTKAQVQTLIDTEKGQGGIVGNPLYSYIEPTLRLTYKFAQTIVTDNHGVAEYVDTLPTATKWHYGRGCWVPLKDDGEHAVGHLHKCVEEAVYEGTYADASCEEYDSTKQYYQENEAGVIVPVTAVAVRPVQEKDSITTKQCIAEAKSQSGGKPILREGDPTVQAGFRYYWVDIQEGGTTIGALGAQFTVVYSEDATMWKHNYIYWKDPQDTVVSGVPVKWAKTILVRKIGSAPANINDGIQIAVSTTRNEYLNSPFLDVTPYTMGEKVYYAVFSVSKAGSYFAKAPTAEAKKMDWTMLLKIISDGYAGSVFHTKQFDGDGNETAPASTIVLPYHSTYGYIECEVVAVDHDATGAFRRGLLVVSKDVICQKLIDSVELRQRLIDATWQTNPEYTEGKGDTGSNGLLSGATHQLASLNLYYWLNSKAKGGTWWAATTSFDQMADASAGGYSAEDGFLRGFEDTSMFAEHGVDTIDAGVVTDAAWLSDGVRVLLPYFKVDGAGGHKAGYFDYITKAKQCGRDRTLVDWFTFSGVPTNEGGRQNRGFYTVHAEGMAVSYGEVSPEVAKGIVPMFFIAPST